VDDSSVRANQPGRVDHAVPMPSAPPHLFVEDAAQSVELSARQRAVVKPAPRCAGSCHRRSSRRWVRSDSLEMVGPSESRVNSTCASAPSRPTGAWLTEPSALGPSEKPRRTPRRDALMRAEAAVASRCRAPRWLSTLITGATNVTGGVDRPRRSVRHVIRRDDAVPR